MADIKLNDLTEMSGHSTLGYVYVQNTSGGQQKLGKESLTNYIKDALTSASVSSASAASRMLYGSGEAGFPLIGAKGSVLRLRVELRSAGEVIAQKGEPFVSGLIDGVVIKSIEQSADRMGSEIALEVVENFKENAAMTLLINIDGANVRAEVNISSFQIEVGGLSDRIYATNGSGNEYTVRLLVAGERTEITSFSVASETENVSVGYSASLPAQEKKFTATIDGTMPEDGEAVFSIEVNGVSIQHKTKIIGITAEIDGPSEIMASTGQSYAYTISYKSNDGADIPAALVTDTVSISGLPEACNGSEVSADKIVVKFSEDIKTDSEVELVVNIGHIAISKAIVIKRSVGDANGWEYVDLGLPSGLLWAKCNVGVDKDNQLASAVGDLYGWGEVVDSHGIAADYAKTAAAGITTDLAADSGFDAARVNMGGDWRMPVESEFRELLDNTKYSWTEVDGIPGAMFTSKVNGNSMFIPAWGATSEQIREKSHEVAYGWLNNCVDSETAKGYILEGLQRYTATMSRPVARNVRAVL